MSKWEDIKYSYRHEIGVIKFIIYTYLIFLFVDWLIFDVYVNAKPGGVW